MLVTIQSTVPFIVCHGYGHRGEAGYFTGPLGEERTSAKWAAPRAQPLRAAQSTPYDRGLAEHAFALQVQRSFAAEDEAALYRHALPGLLPRGENDISVESASGCVVHEGGVLEALDIEQVGVSLDIVMVFQVKATHPQPTVTTASLAEGTVGAAYSQALAASGGTSYTWSIVSGALPAGLSLSAGTISGTPTEAGAFALGVKCLDASGAWTVVAFTLTVEEA